MKNNFKFKVVTFLFVSSLTLPAFAFMGAMMNMGRQMMGPMNPMQMMNHSQMMMQMCGTGMGQMAGGAMNMMGSMMSMMPMGGNMMQGMSEGMMKQVLASPQMTLQALDCAHRNQQMVQMMLKTLSGEQRILHQMAQIMVRDPRISSSMMSLALTNPQVGDFLLTRMDGFVYNELSYAMLLQPGLATKVSTLVWQHRKRHLQKGSPMVDLMSRWGKVDEDYDELEYATERFLFSVFSDVRAAYVFMTALAETDEMTKGYLLDVIFLGKVKDYYYDSRTGKKSDAEFFNQSFHNLYAVTFGLNISLATPDKNGELGAKSNEGKALMKEMMKYMINHESKQPTEWGMRLMISLVAGGMIHQDERIGHFAQFLMKTMPPKFANGLPKSLDFPTPKPDFSLFEVR